MTIEERRLEQQRRIWTALKANWKLQPKVPLAELLITAVEKLGAKDSPRDLRDVQDDLLLEALEHDIIRIKAVSQRLRKKRTR